MSPAGAYALAKRDPGLAAAWDAALAARGSARWSAAKPVVALGDAALLRRLDTAKAMLAGRHRGIVAQQDRRGA